jgi:hypothetical protein
MSPPRYRLVVKGELGPRYASAFDGMTIRAHNGVTDITGPVIDQSHLQGLLERIARRTRGSNHAFVAALKTTTLKGIG